MPITTPQFRPPQDNLCPLLRLSFGCSHGKCRFCSIYDDESFSVVPMDTVIADIEDIAKTATALTRRIFLVGGNVFCLPTAHLIEVFEEVRKRIPTIKEFGGFCRIMDVAAKSDEELAQLAAYGVNNLSLGAESGWDPSLAFLQKGHTGADIVEQVHRLKAAGIDSTLFYLAGSCGHGNGQENALASARVFSEANAKCILIVTLTPTKSWPLKEDIAAGRWTPPGEIETVEEIRTFIANLDPAICTSKINASHDSDVVRFEGLMPPDHENMVALLDHMLPKISEKAARDMRGFIHGANYYD